MTKARANYKNKHKFLNNINVSSERQRTGARSDCNIGDNLDCNTQNEINNENWHSACMCRDRVHAPREPDPIRQLVAIERHQAQHFARDSVDCSWRRHCRHRVKRQSQQRNNTLHTRQPIKLHRHLVQSFAVDRRTGTQSAALAPLQRAASSKHCSA